MMISVLQRIARGVFFTAPRPESLPARDDAELAPFDYDSFEHVIGLHMPADQCRRSYSLDRDGRAYGEALAVIDFPQTRPDVQLLGARRRSVPRRLVTG